jgi:hypothetical protein
MMVQIWIKTRTCASVMLKNGCRGRDGRAVGAPGPNFVGAIRRRFA